MQCQPDEIVDLVTRLKDAISIMKQNDDSKKENHWVVVNFVSAGEFCLTRRILYYQDNFTLPREFYLTKRI